MLRHKNIDRVCCVILAVTLIISGLFVGAAATGRIEEDTTMGYETRLFDQSRVHTIDIVMNDWEDFLETAASEEYAVCHLVIDGESFKNVAIRGKGNTSLTSVKSYGNNRYSFKVEFDHYQTGNTYHGLDKLSLNNLIQDNTYMKDYISYTLMNRMGVAAPLCSFVQINVNGEPWGLYLAVEGVEDGFLQRNYGKNYGELYKPDSLSFGGGRGNGRDFDMDEAAEMFGFSFGENGGEIPNFSLPQGNMPDMSQMPFGGNVPDMSGMFQMPPGSEMPDTNGMPQMPSGSEMPDMSGMFQMPSGSEMPDMSSMPQMPSGSEMPDMSGMFQMPSGSEMPDMSSMPQMPSGGNMPGMGTAPQGADSAQQTPSPADDAADDRSFTPSEWSENFKMPAMDFGGGFGMGSNDVKLIYSGDDPSGYSNIFNNAKTDITTADQTRLIASLKSLGDGDTSVVNTDAVIRYMAVHNFLCNDDSYTGTMIHNYYLYEENGVLEMIPWDYNLAFGGFQGGGNAGSIINRDITSLVNGGGGDRPMADWITANEESKKQYLSVYAEFMSAVFDSGWFASEFDRVTEMIAPYVQNDPTAFCTYEEFRTGAETLRQFCLKRAESVKLQLAGQKADVDAADLAIASMGSMGQDMGGGMEFPGGGMEFPGGSKREGGFTGGKDRSARGNASDAQTAEDKTAKTDDGAFSPKSSEQETKNWEDRRIVQPRADDQDGLIYLILCAVLLCGALLVVCLYPNKR